MTQASVIWEEGLLSEEPTPSDRPVGTTVGANPGQVVLGDVRKEDEHRPKSELLASSFPSWVVLCSCLSATPNSKDGLSSGHVS